LEISDHIEALENNLNKNKYEHNIEFIGDFSAGEQMFVSPRLTQVLRKLFGDSLTKNSFLKGAGTSTILHLLKQSKVIHFMAGEFIYAVNQPADGGMRRSLKCTLSWKEESTVWAPGASASSPTFQVPTSERSK